MKNKKNKKKKPSLPSPPAQYPRSIKAYESREFLHSAHARTIRVLCEFIEPGTRFEELRIKDTIVFFGSARILPHDKAKANFEAIQKKIEKATHPHKELDKKLRIAEHKFRMSRYYQETQELSRRMTEWSIGLNNPDRRVIVCSGGGPGIMEAANRGAQDADGISIGLNISLPFEQIPNPYITPDLCFEFHYFFMRKYWFFHLAKALVVFPGGFGTMDELFDLLTLVQTKKTYKPMPIVLYGTEFWKDVLNFDNLIKWGTISEEDLNLFYFCDDVDSAFEYLTGELTNYYL